MSLADEKEPVRICWYGNPGASKTTNLVDLANLGRMYVVDADAGLKARALRDFNIDVTNIEPYRTISYTALDGLFWDIKAELDDDPDHCVGLGIDTATEVTLRMLTDIVDQKQGAKIAKIEARGEDASDVDPFFRDRDYYGTLAEQFRRLLRGWKDLGINLGITAHIRRDVDENTGKVQYGPAVSPAIQNDLMGAMDVVARCRVDGVWPKGYEVAGAEAMDVMVADMREVAGAGGFYLAKDRFHRTPRVLVNPTFTRIIAYIEGELTVDDDEQQAAYRELFQSRKAEAKRIEEERAARKAARTGKKTAAPAKKTAASKTAASKITAVDEDQEDEDGED